MRVRTDQVDLWCTRQDEISERQLLDSYRDLLNEAERQQERRYRFPRDRHRYLVTRALLRTTLSKYADLAPGEWRFEHDAYGRPHIANSNARAARLSFNVSHTDNLIVVCVANSLTVGVDTENICSRAAPLEIATHYLATDELTALDALPAQARPERFFEYWTLKESYVKARGMGLSIPLQEFSFRFPGPREIILSLDSSQRDDAARWQFWLLRVGREHLVSVCAERSAQRCSNLVAKRTIPLLLDSPLEFEVCAQTSSSTVPTTWPICGHT